MFPVNKNKNNVVSLSLKILQTDMSTTYYNYTYNEKNENKFWKSHSLIMHFSFNTYSRFNFAFLLVPSRFAKGFV